MTITDYMHPGETVTRPATEVERQAIAEGKDVRRRAILQAVASWNADHPAESLVLLEGHVVVSD